MEEPIKKKTKAELRKELVKKSRERTMEICRESPEYQVWLKRTPFPNLPEEQLYRRFRRSEVKRYSYYKSKSNKDNIKNFNLHLI